MGWSGGNRINKQFYYSRNCCSQSHRRKAKWKFSVQPFRNTSPENFWKFTYCNGCFSAFWIIFTQILFKFFDPNSECIAKYDAFCSHIFDYAYIRRKAYCYQKGSNYRKIVYIKSVFENCWWEDAFPSSYPSVSAPGHKLQKPPKKSGIF